jgi:hypothetical protein
LSAARLGVNTAIPKRHAAREHGLLHPSCASRSLSALSVQDCRPHQMMEKKLFETRQLLSHSNSDSSSPNLFQMCLILANHRWLALNLSSLAGSDLLRSGINQEPPVLHIDRSISPLQPTSSASREEDKKKFSYKNGVTSQSHPSQG